MGRSQRKLTAIWGLGCGRKLNGQREGEVRKRPSEFGQDAEHITPVLQSLQWLPVRQRNVYKLATLVHKCLTGRAPEYLAKYCHQAGTRRPGIRSAGTSTLDVPAYKNYTM